MFCDLLTSEERTLIHLLPSAHPILHTLPAPLLIRQMVLLHKLPFRKYLMEAFLQIAFFLLQLHPILYSLIDCFEPFCDIVFTEVVYLDVAVAFKVLLDSNQHELFVV